MSNKPYVSLIDDEEKQIEADISIDYDVYTMATFDVTMVREEMLEGFDEVSIDRDEVEIFNGRVDEFTPLFSRGGRKMRVNGFDNTVRLRDYKTPITTVAGTTTAAMLGTIVSETPFNTSTIGTFEYITELKDWNTWMEMLLDIEVFTDVTIELDLDTVEISDLVNAGTWTGCLSGLKSCFFYDGTTPRFYIFVVNATNDLYYYHSTDGDTWTGVDTTYNVVVDYWSVAWHDSKVYLFTYDTVNTDFYRGTINDGTGAITFGVATGNIFADEIIFGPVFDDSDHIWVIRNNANGQAYESTDDGATFNNRFGPGANFLWGILPTGTDGDMYGFEIDSVANDLEEWLWDRSAGTYTFQNKITDENDIDLADACSDADYNPYFIWEDGGDVFITTNKSGAWTVDSNSLGVVNALSVGSDGYSAYIWLVGNFGFRVYKYAGTTEIQDSGGLATYDTPSYVNCPRGYLQDGVIAQFGTVIHSTDDDPYFHVFSQLGLRLVEGSSVGSIRTDTVTASGSFTNWGLCTALGNADIDDTDWNILRSADNSELIDDQNPNFDMDLAGVPNTDLSIKVYIAFDGSLTDPIVYEFNVTEKTDLVTIVLDGEDCFTGVGKLADLSGGNFWVEKDNGTYTVYLSTSRGEDKSGWIILKSSTTIQEPDTIPNIKVTSVTYDYSDFANAILFIGGIDEVSGERIEVEVRDNDSIADRGQEYWVTIRDAEVTSTAMGLTKAQVALNNRNAVIIRIGASFIDKEQSNSISIGDTVTLIVGWDDGELNLNGPYRIVRLNRTWGVGGGERVTAEFSNRKKPVQYYNYLQKVDDLERVSTQ